MQGACERGLKIPSSFRGSSTSTKGLSIGFFGMLKRYYHGHFSNHSFPASMPPTKATRPPSCSRRSSTQGPQLPYSLHHCCRALEISIVTLPSACPTTLTDSRSLTTQSGFAETTCSTV